ncbi:MAG: hypothetical protein GC178_14445 [Flavobacteriales bacterium]|nr:hypothetical protein [Flavobacteriales bacterium]
MPFQDMINNHVPDLDKQQAGTLMDQVEALLQPFLRNLSEEENGTVGHIDEKTKLFVNKVMDYHTSQPALDSPDVDWVEFEADRASRQFYELLAMRLDALSKALTETRRLHDYDNYQNGLIDYHYAQYKDTTSPGLGYDTKVAELGQFFTGGGSSSTDDSAPQP